MWWLSRLKLLISVIPMMAYAWRKSVRVSARESPTSKMRIRRNERRCQVSCIFSLLLLPRLLRLPTLPSICLSTPVSMPLLTFTLLMADQVNMRRRHRHETSISWWNRGHWRRVGVVLMQPSMPPTHLQQNQDTLPVDPLSKTITWCPQWRPLNKLGLGSSWQF